MRPQTFCGSPSIGVCLKIGSLTQTCAVCIEALLVEHATGKTGGERRQNSHFQQFHEIPLRTLPQRNTHCPHEEQSLLRQNFKVCAACVFSAA